MYRPLALLCLLLYVPVAAPAQQASRSVKDELIRLDRAIMNADLHGDRAFFERILSDGYIQASSTGKVLTRAEALKEIQATPKSLSVQYDLKDARVLASGNYAVLNVRTDDRTDVSGQKVTSSWRTTQVWMRQHGRWRLVAEHTSRIPRDPVAATIDTSVYDSYVGKYEVGPGFYVMISRDGGKLMVQTTGDKTKTELLPENQTTFFSKDDMGRTIFKKDDSGQVVDCMYRTSDGQEIHAKRVK